MTQICTLFVTNARNSHISWIDQYKDILIVALFGMSNSTIASECIECYVDRTKEIKRDDNRKRIIFLESYLEKKGDPKYIKIDESNHQSKCQDQNAGLDGSL